MSLSFSQLKGLSKAIVNAQTKANTQYTMEDGTVLGLQDMNDTMRDELNKKLGSFNDYRRNKVEYFELMEETIDAKLPPEVMSLFGAFANTKVFKQGQQPVFTRKLGKNRAKSFITKAVQAGVYETFKLDEEKIVVPTMAYGGAAQISIEEFLDGTIDWNELIDIVMEGLVEAVYREINAALVNVVNYLPAANKASSAQFDGEATDKVLATVGVYGKPTIFCTYEFAQKIVPDTNFISDEDKSDKRNQGYIGTYHGSKVVLLPQSFEDETNTTKVIDPSYGWVFPNGNQKAAYVAFEGQTVVKDFDNRDMSTEIQAYKKFGVAITAYNHIGSIRITSLTKAV